MNNSSYPGLNALRSESAPAELQSRILAALKPDPRRDRKVKALRITFATALGALILAGILLAPRASVAAAVSKVLKAFRNIGRYHLKAYEIIDGTRHLISETWVSGETRKFKAYAPDGSVLPNSSEIGAVTDKLNKAIQGLTPKELLDPALNDRLSAITGSLGPNPGIITERITVDGVEVHDLPEGVKAQIMAMSPSEGMRMNIGGPQDIARVCGLLKDPSLWDIDHNQRLNNKTVDRYRIKNTSSGYTLWVDPDTHLPLRIEFKSTFAGREMTSMDDLDYPSSGP